MTAAVAGEIYQVLIQGLIEEQECENVIYFRAQAADPDVLAGLLADLVECFLTGLVPALGGTYTFERLVARRIVPDIGPDVIYTPAGGIATQGATAGDALPSYCSALISLQTTRGGRSGRGRMFIAGIPESQTVASRIPSETALWAALIAFVACMLGKFLHKDVPGVGDWEWGVFSRKLGGAKAPFSAAGFAYITAATPRNLLATTRSRKIGHGR
jgi:hypothetical protein